MGILIDLLRSFFYYVGYCYYTEQVPRFRSTYPPFVFFYMRSLCIAHHPPPFQSNNSLQPLAALTFASFPSGLRDLHLFQIHYFLSFFVFIGADQVYSTHTERHVMTCCAQKATAVYSPDDSHLCLHAIERDEETDAAWHIRRSYTYRIGA